jgi:hypothetical protein
VQLPDPQKPDRLERIIRFACGAGVGAIIGAQIYVLIVPVSMVLCGLLAMYFGDRFWVRLRDWL